MGVIDFSYDQRPLIYSGACGPECPPKFPIDPDWDLRETIAAASKADIGFCWTCGSCDNGCPVNIATGRLHPQVTVRLAAYGMMDELLRLPDIWYCLSCRLCFQGCPIQVKPYELHTYLQHEAVARGLLPEEFINAYRQLFSEFQRVRWRTVAHCFQNRLTALPDATWYQWLKTPLRKPVYNPITLTSRARNKSVPSLPASSCFTCSECSGCCPITCDGDVFDPQRIIRKINLGLVEKELRSPEIWLCLGCKRCSEACSQTVSGYDIILQLQRQAIAAGYVDSEFPSRLLEADRIIYPKFLHEIDTLIGLYSRIS